MTKTDVLMFALAFQTPFAAIGAFYIAILFGRAKKGKLIASVEVYENGDAFIIHRTLDTMQEQTARAALHSAACKPWGDAWTLR